jgi:Transposase DDE domain
MSETISTAFFQPILDLIPLISAHRPGLDFSDADFTLLGLRRIQALQPSGRGFLQSVRLRDLTLATVRAYFGAGQSPRRLEFLHELNHCLSLNVPSAIDRFAPFPELHGVEVLAIDGHAIRRGCHEPAEVTTKGKYEAPASATGIFLHNLRNRASRVLAQTEGHQHEWAAVKAQPWSEFHWVKGSRGTILIIDPVAVDFEFLRAAKYKGGCRVITRSKSHLAPDRVVPLEWDKADRRNDGVTGDERVHFAKNGEFRRIRYVNPETGELYEFLTTDFHLPPGVIAQLYRLRWDIEKFFDVCENVWSEKKAWGAGPVAAQVQNEFLVLTQNLVLLLNHRLEQQESIRDKKAEDKYQKWLEQRGCAARALGRSVSPWVQTLRAGVTRWSCQFIRWLADALLFDWPWRAGVEKLRPLMLAYMR